MDLWLIEEAKVRDPLKQQPHAALHHAMVKTSCKEIKTYGWVITDSLMTGYCTTSEEDAKIILEQSGAAGVFTTRLRQDITEQRPVTWVKMEENEPVLQYHARAMKLAAENGVAAARRAGGGAFWGYLKEDCTLRNRAWSVSGIPFTWGPTTVKAWLEEIGWTTEHLPKPPNGKYRTWAFQGLHSEHPTQRQFAYEVNCGNGTCHALVQRWQKKRVPTDEEKEQEHRAPGWRWWSADATDPIEETISPTQVYSTDVAATRMDTQDDNEARNKRATDGQTEESPKKKKSK